MENIILIMLLTTCLGSLYVLQNWVKEKERAGSFSRRVKIFEINKQYLNNKGLPALSAYENFIKSIKDLKANS